MGQNRRARASQVLIESRKQKGKSQLLVYKQWLGWMMPLLRSQPNGAFEKAALPAFGR